MIDTELVSLVEATISAPPSLETQDPYLKEAQRLILESEARAMHWERTS